MFNRRELLLGLAGAAVARADDLSVVRPSHLYTPLDASDIADILIGQHSQPGTVRVVLQGMPPGALTGIAASMMRPAESTGSPWLTMKLRPGEARVSLGEPHRECVISLRNGCEGFVASWALPIVQHGAIGYDPTRELPLLLSARVGEYWPLREGDSPPAALARATAVYACLFGDYEARTFERMQVVMDRFTRPMGPGVSFIFNAIIHPAHEPSVLLTVFT